jgi:hypothetical protein
MENILINLHFYCIYQFKDYRLSMDYGLKSKSIKEIELAKT